MTQISDKYAQLGGAGGFLGGLLSAEQVAANGGIKQEFQHGSIYWHPTTGAHEVHGAIRTRWLDLGAEGSDFGYPVSDETVSRDGVGRFSEFQGATVLWHPATGAFEVHGLIRARWRDLGAEISPLGYPTTNESVAPDGFGRYNHFEHGSIFWTPTTGAHEVWGAARERWAELRWERGLLGYPIAAPSSEIRNRVPFDIALFQGGKIEVNTQTSQVAVEKAPSVAAPNYSIPIVAYRVSDDDGGRQCSISADGVRQWVDEANRVYAAAGVQFTYDGMLTEMHDTEVNNLTGEGDSWWPSARDRLDSIAAARRSVVVVFRFGPGTSSIGGGFSWWTYDFVAMSFFDPNALQVLPHELGHHFGLAHTHSRDFKTVRDAVDYVLSGQSIPGLDGDLTWVDDTPPDPHILALQDVTSVVTLELAGQAFSLSRKNIMSYWNHGGVGQLTQSQIDRVRQLVLERRSRYLDVKEVLPFDCTQLNARLASQKARLVQLIADRDAETDPILRRRYAGQIAATRSQIARSTAEAHSAGCV